MDSNENAIEITNLTKRYKTKTVVDELNLSIKEGEIFALLGENGAGKTTTIKILSCLLLPTSGDAKIKNHSILGDINKVKELINVSPQETAIAPNLSAKENLTFIAEIYGAPKREAEKKADEMLTLFGLQNRAKDKAKTFSGGMQRRLSIAMALITDPEILFLDEPTLGLDPQARQELWDQITKLKGKKTVILTTHYLEEADALADHIGILKGGKLIAYGTSQELKNNLTKTKTVTIKCQVTPDIIDKLRPTYTDVQLTKDGLEIKANDIDYNKILNLLSARDIKVDNISTKESSLEDVYFAFNTKEGSK